MIDGVLVEPLKIIKDKRGEVRHMLRSDAPFFEKFGEIYFSTVNPGFIKGWKQHRDITQHFAVVVGDLKLVLFDGRDQSKTFECTQELFIGESQYSLVRIPKGIWYAFSAVGNKPAVIANCTDLPHDPQESVQKELNDPSITYTWN